jgi:hypothetical protein
MSDINIRVFYTIETLTRRPGGADFVVLAEYAHSQGIFGSVRLSGTWLQRHVTIELASAVSPDGCTVMWDRDAELEFLADWLREADEGDEADQTFVREDDEDDDDE